MYIASYIVTSLSQSPGYCQPTPQELLWFIHYKSITVANLIMLRCELVIAVVNHSLRIPSMPLAFDDMF